MFTSRPEGSEPLGEFRIQGAAMRYSQFVPRLYNFCLQMGMRRGYIMPSRAFCSDENQGYPIILIAKHFGTFPFNHGRVGGIVATDRHGPHAHHGEDLVIIQASHVGYDPETETFGTYRRLQTEEHEKATSCGKVCGVLDWYQNEYRFAQQHVLLKRTPEGVEVTIDNQLLRKNRKEGLFLNLEKLVRHTAEGHPDYVRSLSTSKVFHATDMLASRLDRLPADGERVAIGTALTSELFYYQREIHVDVEGKGHLEQNLIHNSPQIVTSPAPSLTAALINTQMEFDRTYRTLEKSGDYRGKHLLFVSGLNIDVSPSEGNIFPLTKFVPWAAYLQQPDGTRQILEQDELVEVLMAQDTANPDKIDLTAAIHSMEEVKEVVLKLP